jgi:hypothetical protein
VCALGVRKLRTSNYLAYVVRRLCLKYTEQMNEPE